MGVKLSSPSHAKRSWRHLLFQFLRFSLVGGLNTFIDVMVFNILVLAFPTQHIHRLVFYNTLAYLVGAVNSFCWNKLWTFEERFKIKRGQVARFALVTCLGILCNDALLWLATNMLAAFSISGFLWTNVAKISAIAGTVTISYIGMRFSVFIKSEKDETLIPPPSNPYLFITPQSLSVVLPAYNEEAVIANTIVTIISTLTTWMRDFEVIVVNDGSRAFFMDSDGQFDINDLAHFFPLIEEYDAVLGYRIDRQDTWMRKLNAWGWKQLVQFIFGVRARDIDCAFKLFRSEFFRTHRLETRGAMINTEILYKFTRAGYTYTEVGVHHLPRRAGKATGAKPTVILRALYEMLVYAGKWRQEELQLLYSYD